MSKKPSKVSVSTTRSKKAKTNLDQPRLRGESGLPYKSERDQARIRQCSTERVHGGSDSGAGIDSSVERRVNITDIDRESEATDEVSQVIQTPVRNRVTCWRVLKV